MIDYSETRGISEEVLNELLQDLNPKFINELPDTPQEILRFARRRVNPYISDNISSTLAKQMIDTRLSDKEYLLTLFKAMRSTFSTGQEPSAIPTAAILISQTGAGKTSLREAINPNGQEYVVINPDLYKKYRTDVEEIRAKDRTHFGALTGIDSYDHADNIRNYAMQKGYNILIEVAPSLKQGLIGVDEKALQKHGYQLNLHVMAVGDLVSAISVHHRYESSIFVYAGKGDTKLTDLSRHDDSYAAVPECIKLMDPRNISLYVRSENVAIPPRQIRTEGRSMPEIIKLLQQERAASNYAYVVGSGRTSFEKDYKTIIELMQARNAPQEEYNQLNTIYERYLQYKSKNKVAEGR